VIFMKEKEINPLKGLIPPFIQAPIFISFFFGIRGMANLPLDSFKDGGILWFTDLTLPDPLYILPVVTSLTLLATIELGAEGGLRADNMQWARYLFRGLPFIIFPFMINFPSAILCYWCASNAFTLGQVGFLKIEAVRNYCNLPKLIKHDKKKLALSKKGFVEGITDSYTNTKISKEIEQRARGDEIRFKQAGMGPPVKTYKYDPTKVHASGVPKK